jgi:MFS family permease
VSSSAKEIESSAVNGRWVLLSLLVLSVAINYIDRGNLSIAAATNAFRQDVQVNDKDLGALFSAFFFTYAACQIFSGWVIDRWSVYAVYSAGFVLWSAATIATGFAGGFASLLLLRLVLGVGEACAYPAYSKMIAINFPEDRRGFANALIDAGSRTGPAIGVLGGGLIVAHSGWRMLFFAVGGAGLLWLLPWFWHLQQRTGVFPQTKRAQTGPGLAPILRQRQAWGTFLGLFCLNYSWFFVMTWLPIYFTQERHFSTQMMALYGSLPFWGIAATTVTCGWLSDRAIRRGANPSRIRIGCVAGGLMLNVMMIAAYAVHDPIISMVLLIVACLALGISSSNFWAVTQSLAGTQAVGRWTGLQNGLGNLAGIVGPYVTGLIVHESGSFFWAFALASAMSAIGACSYLFIVRGVREVQWNEPELAVSE